MSYSDSEKNYWRRKPGTVEPSDELYRKFWSIKPKKPKKPSEIEESARGKIIESAGSSPALLPKTSDIPSPTLSGDDSIRESFQGGPQAQLYPDPRSLAPPIQQPNPYAAGGEKMFGNMSVNNFSILAGMAADAIAPNKLGRDIAAYADRNEQNRLKFEMEAPERAQRLQNSELIAQNMYEQNKLINPRFQLSKDAAEHTMDYQDKSQEHQDRTLEVMKENQKETQAYRLQALAESQAARKDTQQYRNTVLSQDANQMTSNVVADPESSTGFSYTNKSGKVIARNAPISTSSDDLYKNYNAKMENAESNLHSKLAKFGTKIDEDRTITVEADANGNIKPELKRILEESGLEITDGAFDSEWHISGPRTYTKTFSLGGLKTGKTSPASTGKKKKPEKPYDPDFYKIK